MIFSPSKMMCVTTADESGVHLDLQRTADSAASPMG